MFYKYSVIFLQNSLEITCAGVLFIRMLPVVASVPRQEYIKDEIPTHVPAFLSSNSIIFYFLPQRSDFPLKNVYCIRSVLTFPLKNLYCICLVVMISEAYSELCQTSKMEFFTKTVNGLKPQKIPS